MDILVYGRGANISLLQSKLKLTRLKAIPIGWRDGSGGQWMCSGEKNEVCCGWIFRYRFILASLFWMTFELRFLVLMIWGLWVFSRSSHNGGDRSCNDGGGHSPRRRRRIIPKFARFSFLVRFLVNLFFFFFWNKVSSKSILINKLNSYWPISLIL